MSTISESSSKFPYQEFYYSTVCHVCKMKCRELKSCKNCKVYRYCSQEHQAMDWPQHKSICNILRTFMDRVSVDNCFNIANDGWLLARLKIKMVLENELNRSLSPAENQVWMFPRACAVCYETDIQTLFDCAKCPATSYCSSKHQMLIQNKHKEICKQMHLQYLYYCSKMRGELEDEIRKLYSTFGDAVKLFNINYEEPDHQVLLTVQECDRLSHILTLYNGLVESALLNNDNLRKLVIHIVGVTYEWSNFDKHTVENIFHWIPNLQTLRICFIGPELSFGETDEWTFCDKCNERNVNIDYEFEPLTYEEYFHSDKYKEPSAVIVYNCGFHEEEDLEIDLWKDTLPLLVRLNNVPLVVTSYTLNEAVKDFERIIQLSSDRNPILVYKKYERNTFHSPLPLRDWITDEFYYVNNYHSIFMKK